MAGARPGGTSQRWRPGAVSQRGQYRPSGMRGKQPGRDRRTALLASAESPRGQPGESLFDVLQFPAGRDRPAQQHLRLLQVRLVSQVVRGSAAAW